MPNAEISIVSGPEGQSLYIGDESGGHRLSGPKPWGGGTTTHTFKIDLDELIREAAALRDDDNDAEPDLRPGLEWAIARCKALQTQGFSHSRNDVLIKDFQNCISSLTPLKT